jgi:A nuclease of the HNH/ENDO VII superfamily with conserved WHH
MADFAGQRGLDVNEVRGAATGLRDMSAKYGEFALDAGLAAGGALPPPFGTAADIASLGKSIYNLDGWGVVFDVIGFVPLLGDGIKGGRVVAKLADLGRVVDEAVAGLAKTFNKTEEAAKAFWASKKNMEAYREALKRCNGTKECMDAAALNKGQQYAQTPKSGPHGNWSPPDGRGDGQWTPTPGSKLAEAIKPQTSITYENGFPNFDQFSQGSVKIPQSGNSLKDMELADDLFRKQTNQPDWARDSGMTWHHKEDGTTMQLVPSAINNNSGHSGGASLFGGTSTGREF